jgi:hypothetical protein
MRTNSTITSSGLAGRGRRFWWRGACLAA